MPVFSKYVIAEGSVKIAVPRLSDFFEMQHLLEMKVPKFG
jgi:hypothetical protein